MEQQGNHPHLLLVPAHVCMYILFLAEVKGFCKLFYICNPQLTLMLSFLLKDEHCLFKHFVSWPKDNHVRQQQREAEGNKKEPGSQSPFKAVVHLAKEFGSVPVPSLNPASLSSLRCVGQGNLLRMGHMQSKKHSGQMWLQDKDP